MTSPPALRPPAWAENYRWHWLSARDHTSILQWRNEHWQLWDYSKEFSPEELAVHGWTYSHPADPSARVIDPENEAMVKVVILALREKLGGDRKNVARAILTALKEMP